MEARMKVVILSDIHGNFDALSALREDYDELWVLGDLVNYGPQPAEVLRFVKAHATHVVRGNHDHSIGFNVDPGCAPAYREMADATRKYTASVLSEDDKQYLRSLPLQATASAERFICKLCHAVPSDPLYTYCPPDSDRWISECKDIAANLLLVGHTHIQFARRIGNTLVVNPGSLGQPKSGGPPACYAVLKDGRLGFRSLQYPIEKTIEKIRHMPVLEAVQRDLIAVLATGAGDHQWTSRFSVSIPGS
jgi:putative phosphoesterase